MDPFELIAAVLLGNQLSRPTVIVREPEKKVVESEDLYSGPEAAKVVAAYEARVTKELKKRGTLRYKLFGF